MSDERIIRALVGDLRPVKPIPPTNRLLLVYLAASALVVFVFTKMGTAVDAPAILPVLLCATLLVTGAAGALGSAIPGRTSWWFAGAAVIAALVVWSADIALRLAASLPDSSRAWGDSPWVKCFGFTVGVSVLPSLVLIRLVRAAWPVQPRATAALIFVSGASTAALTTTLECPSQALLHVLLGHLLPVIVLAGIGVTAAPALLNRERRGTRTDPTSAL